MDRLTSIASHLNANQTGAESGDVFGHLQLAPPDPILGTALAYKADTSKDKMDLGVGAYRDDNEKPYVFNVVKKAEQEILSDKSLNKEYLPIDGIAQFCDLSQKLIFGAENPLVKAGKIVTVQTLSGTGSLRVGFEFVKNYIPGDVYVSKPTWGNHHAIIEKAGLKWIEYPYYDDKTRGLNFNGMYDCLKGANSGSIVLLHACAHNPTGVDPTAEQWRQLAKLFKEKKLFPYFDSAYQGYASGDLEKDAQAIHIFLNEGLQMLVSQSYAKNFGLYGERIGALHFVCTSKDVAAKVLSQVKIVIRPMYSNPPLHGARIVSKVLGNPQLAKEWKDELKAVSQRIISMRKVLREELIALGTKGTWDHIVNQIGMFSYTGLTPKQCEVLINKYHIYLLKNGRISMAGITTKNVKYLANAIHDAVTNN
jgi:aspartate/tyrosine/aromatic aminotransferase